MKVCIVADTIYGFVSGAAIFTKRLVEQLSTRVDEVVVITSGEKREVRIEGNKTIYFYPGLKIKKFKKFSMALFPFRAINHLFKTKKFDLVHIQLPSPLCVAALYQARKHKIPTVVTSHTQPDNILGNFKLNSKPTEKIFYRYITWLYNFADYIVCPSEHARKELIAHGIKKSKNISVISNGIDTNYFVPAGQKSNVVLFVGRLMKEKCIPTLIKASVIIKKKHPDFEFIIAGDGYQKEELEAIAADLNPDIKFTGSLANDELVTLYQKAKIFVLPSESELQGIVLLESMSCGAVTIASDSDKSAAKELSNFSFKHNDEEELARRINFLIENPELMEKLTKENRKTMVEQHDYSKVMAQYLDIYENAISNRKNIERSKLGRKKRKINKLDFDMVRRVFSAKYFNKQFPLWVDMRVTNKCNLRCIYCDIPNIKMKELSTEQWKHVVDKVRYPSWFLMTGGEPLVRKDAGDLIDYIIFHSKHKVILNTNLVLLKKRYEEVKYCDGFYFSLDGTKETHEKNKGANTWKPLIESLELLHKERRGKISMTVITSNTTIDDIKEILRLCEKFEIIPAFQVVRHYDHSNKSKEFSPDLKNILKIIDFLVDKRKKGFVMMNSVKGLMAQKDIVKKKCNLSCYSGRLFCTIDSDGVMGLCFSRPRSNNFKNLSSKTVSYKKAMKSLIKEKPHINRCPSCSCMAPVEFSLADFYRFDVIHHNDQSFTKFINLENDYIKKLNKKRHNL